MNILVVRNDKLGDFMLAWPAMAIIKHYWPEARLVALVPDYTASIARLCPWIDEVLIDQGEGAPALAARLRGQHFDAMLTLYSSRRVAIAGWLARIPYRLAPATKLFQFLYNHRLSQRRSRSEKPEYAYNIDLAYRLLNDFNKPAPASCAAENGDYLPKVLQRPLLTANVPNAERYLVIHPGSGGSANNLSPEQYAQLAKQITDKIPVNVVITAGPGEEESAQRLTASIGGHARVAPPAGIEALIETLSGAALFISNSTGPLHIAAALDRPTAAFYPRHRSATPLRWQTLNAPEKRLAFTPPEGAAAEDVGSIDIDAAALAIIEHLLQ